MSIENSVSILGDNSKKLQRRWCSRFRQTRNKIGKISGESDISITTVRNLQMLKDIWISKILTKQCVAITWARENHSKWNFKAIDNANFQMPLESVLNYLTWQGNYLQVRKKLILLLKTHFHSARLAEIHLHKKVFFQSCLYKIVFIFSSFCLNFIFSLVPWTTWRVITARTTGDFWKIRIGFVTGAHISF